jgi:hypothetical protein
VDTVRSECSKEMRAVVEDSQARLEEELVSMQQRLVAELRAETTAAFNRESAAIAALDEQLWITDQRLGQRIDELSHLHIRDRAAGSKTVSRIFSFSTDIPEDSLGSALDRSASLREPVTSEERERRPRSGLFAAAHQAARLLEASRDDEELLHSRPTFGQNPRQDEKGSSIFQSARKSKGSLASHRRAAGSDAGSPRAKGKSSGGGILSMACKAAEAFAESVDM